MLPKMTNKGLMTKKDWAMMNFINFWGFLIIGAICFELKNFFGGSLFFIGAIVIFIWDYKYWGLKNDKTKT